MSSNKVNNVLQLKRREALQPYLGVVEWRSHRYPDKEYVAHCFTPEMYQHVIELVMRIDDYHTVIDTMVPLH